VPVPHTRSFSVETCALLRPRPLEQVGLAFQIQPLHRVLAQHEHIERKAQLHRAAQRLGQLRQVVLRRAPAHQVLGERLVRVRRQLAVVIGHRHVEVPGAHHVTHDLGDLLLVVTQRRQRRPERLVGDLEVAAAGQLLELHQREVRLDAGRVAVHQQADRAGRRDHGRLGVAEPVRLATLERIVPRPAGVPQQRVAVRQASELGLFTLELRRVDRHRGRLQPLVPAQFVVGALVAVAAHAVRRPAVVADHAQHVIAVAEEPVERAVLAGHFRAAWRSCGR
jgi:hypothetical protein